MWERFQVIILVLENNVRMRLQSWTTWLKIHTFDLSLARMIASEVEHESVLRVCVKCVSRTFCEHCSCTPPHVVFTLADIVTSALGQVVSKRVIHGNTSQH